MTWTMTCERAPRAGHLSPPSVSGFRAWLAASASGEAFQYHRGFLVCDRSPASELTVSERHRVAGVADAALGAAEDGLVHLVQRRHGDCDFCYLAIRARAKARGRRAVLPAPACTLPAAA